MQDALYVSLSAQVSRERRLTTIAENIANSQTVGFRATQIRFEELVSDATGIDVSHSSQGVEYADDRSGGLEQTGNPLDFAVRGDAWFGVDTPAGTVMTRDGRFNMTEVGDLVTLSGYPVLDAGGAPIVLDPRGGVPEVSGDGFIRQGGGQVAAIGLFAFEPPPGFQRYGDSGILAGGDPEPIVDTSDVGVVQGYVENSNVDPLREITDLIMVQRAFEQSAKLMQTSEDSIENLIRAMSSS
ncbi:flagellar basal-body rod protein FlgF [Oricola cellulosilytica]|uniref:Flagellar basal-body rod protein FlgF n=1 Tax=Oricola cellulosilytica TaxID=1429082 RepID=A0A4V2MP44_9HYPH|nr:flagellar basal-body rod protein FlgF [Oricola cellulosilytica]TCD16192.1 flagellar basal-body rod protein FlgF [Oricola cellulosilytica]